MSRMVSALVTSLLLFSVLAIAPIPDPAMADLVVWGLKDVKVTEIDLVPGYAGGTLQGWFAYDTVSGSITSWYIVATLHHALVPPQGTSPYPVPPSITFSSNDPLDYAFVLPPATWGYAVLFDNIHSTAWENEWMGTLILPAGPALDGSVSSYGPWSGNEATLETVIEGRGGAGEVVLYDLTWLAVTGGTLVCGYIQPPSDWDGKVYPQGAPLPPSVPIPPTALLLGAGLIPLAWARGKKRLGQ